MNVLFDKEKENTGIHDNLLHAMICDTKRCIIFFLNLEVA